MITLLTGLPGNGKTLFALWSVEKYRVAENKRLEAESKSTGKALVVREVFYAGITDLTLPWTLIEPEKWMLCPPGSIIVIDECQTVFPKKPNGSTLPEHYDKLATHRHHGFDIFLITQHPSLVDNFVRKLTGRHYHAVRKFGMQRATVYEWGACTNSPESAAARNNAVPIKWAYPAEVFTYYKSAEVHTVKRSIPAKLILAVLFVLFFVGAFYFVLDKYQARTRKPTAVDAQGVPVSASSSAAGYAGGSSQVPVDPVVDAKNYVHSSTPRVVGLEHTAPKYDQLTKPVRVPVPAMCIRKGPMCKCYSQQGTPLPVPAPMCEQISHSGYFQEFDADPRAGERLRSDRESVQVAAVAPAESQTIFIPYDPPPQTYK